MPTVSPRRLLHLCALTAAVLAAAVLLGAPGLAGADLNTRIAGKESRADALRSAVAAETRRIRTTERGLAVAQGRLDAVQADVADRRARLRKIEADLVAARDRLTRLENRLHRAMNALRTNLVAAHRNPRPDLVSVVVSARGFSDLLELAEFAKRIARQNAEIIDTARASRAEVTRQASVLVRLQTRNRRLAAALERKRDRAQAIATALLSERASRLAGRASREAELREVRDELGALRRRQARAARAERLQAPASSPNQTIRTDPGGQAQAPAGAPAAVSRVVAAGNAIAGLPYAYGGGHGSFQASAYDCSGSISYALAAAGLLSAPLASGGFMSWGENGPGRYITVYANEGHAFMVVGGWRFDTSALRSGGTRWTRGMRPTGGFVARHPPGL